MRKAVVMLSVVLMLVFATSVYAEVKTDFGASFRLRQEVWDNVVALDTLTSASAKDRDFFRLRASLWGKASFNQDITLYTKLTTEPKYQIGSYRVNAKGDKLDEDEIIFDNIYADFKNIFGMPVDIRLGRQDFLGPDAFGEGFLLLDGTPGDGSRTFYFNALRLTWRITKNNSLDFVYITDTWTDTYLPVLHPGNKKQLTASNEQGYVLYSKNKIGDTFNVEPYYIYKIEQAFGTTPKLKINTIGARAVFSQNRWTVKGEFAHQFGEYDGGRDRRANGGYIFVGRKYPDITLKPEFELGFVYLSGDDPSTPKHEGWNPLFSRAPYWNELIIYTLINETVKDGGPIPGYWTNMLIYKAEAKVSFTDNTKMSAAYSYLGADQATSGLNPAMFSNSGKGRGHMLQAMLTHKFNKNLDGFLQAEYFIPKSFYNDNAKNALFFRWQLQYRI
ncbi:MAG: alginate export family protein [Thermodesulfovibrionales bacterium]|nr:alginate export family protein [Thermodesulfovibrionales bacterium]